MLIVGILLLPKTAKKTMCCYKNINCYQWQVEGVYDKTFHLAEWNMNSMIQTIVGVLVSALACFLSGFNSPVL